jgi:hypothetical protein
MTTFESDGFLSDEIVDYEKEIFERYKDKLRLSQDVNRIAHQIIYAIQIKNEHLPDLLLATLLTRQATSFQAFLILIQKGLLTQVEILLRNIAENMFIIGAIGKDLDFADKYVLAEEVSRKKALVRIKNNMEKNGQKVDQKTIDLIADLDSKIRDESIQTFTTERIAHIAELSSYYDTLYPLTSMAVHTSTRGLDKTLKTNSDGKVISLDYGPAIEFYDMHLDYGISMMLYSLHEIATYFSIDTNNIENLQQRNKGLAGNFSISTPTLDVPNGMTKSTIFIIILSIALVGTILWWILVM